MTMVFIGMCKLQTSKCFLHLSTYFQADSESVPTPSINMAAYLDLTGPQFPMQREKRVDGKVGVCKSLPVDYPSYGLSIGEVKF